MTEAVFSFLESTVASAGVREDARARPIAFEMLDEDAEVWTFDPKSEGPLFSRLPHPEPALTITCRPELLDRLFRLGAQVRADDPLLMHGDVAALDCLIDALAARQGAAAR